ncbi:MAG: type IV pilus assembly protein FimV, partial [Gammaproteobacteria bacterium]
MDFITKNLNLFTKYFTKCFIKWVLRVLISILIFYNNTLLAIGLSEIKVNSYLNEPLRASIKITGAEELDPVSLIADLANAKDFMRAGIPRSFLLSHLKFETKNFNEDLIVHISSNIVIKDPVLDFLLQLTWPEGTMIKSYSILLNPKPVEQKNINTNLDKQLVTDKKAVVDPSKVNNTDAIFASSLEQPNENELLINNKLDYTNNKLNPKKNPKIKNLENFTNIEPNSNHLENLNYLNDNQKDNPNSYSLLTKLINNLQNFSENSNKNKINYQKLLELT